jgi:hypothetical protein
MNFTLLQPQNYGIDGSNNDRQVHRLEHLRSDSGYRSLEHPPAPNLVAHQQSFDMADRLPHVIPIHSAESITASDYHFEMPACFKTSLHSQEGVGDSSTKHRDSFQGVNKLMAHYSHEPDEGVFGLQSPTAPNINVDSWEKCQRKNHYSASRKRRGEFGVGGGRHALAHFMTQSEYSHAYFFHSVGATYTRDYSVDQKSDALFREFSRCDPVKTLPSSSHQQYLKHSRPCPVQDKIKKLLEPQCSDEKQLPQDLLLNVTREESDDPITLDSDDHYEDNCDSNDSDEDDDDSD